jgi:LDH2 family malate/lactate/ureidoglycolate dehydrogenase
MLPMGGPKGSALSIMMDVFSGVLSGSAFAVRPSSSADGVVSVPLSSEQGHVTNPYDPSKPADVGHFIMVIKPDLFLPLEEFRDRMGYLYQRVVQSDKMPGVDRIYFPGEIELLQSEVSLQIASSAPSLLMH